VTAPAGTEARDRLAAALRAWLIDQSQQAHALADHPDGQPGDPGGHFDKGAAHMADATLTQLAELVAAIPAATDEGLRAALDSEMHVAEVREKGIDGRPVDARFWAGYREGLGFARELTAADEARR
jgi:hypothetical protein